MNIQLQISDNPLQTFRWQRSGCKEGEVSLRLQTKDCNFVILRREVHNYVICEKYALDLLSSWLQPWCITLGHVIKLLNGHFSVLNQVKE